VALVEIVLVKAPFTPAPETVIGDLTLADFDGYAPLAVNSATAAVFQDPATGDWLIQLDEPAGGWTWITTGATNLPQTIHGFGLTNSTGATLYGSELLDEPVELTASGQGIDIPRARFRLPADAFS